MKNLRKTFFKVATILIITGMFVSLGTMIAIGFNFSKLDKNTYINKSYTFTEDIQNININIEEADVTILPTEDDTVKVSCLEKEKNPFSVKVVDNNLIIEHKNKSLFNFLDLFSFTDPEITIELPNREFNTITIDTVTSDISVKSVEAVEFDIDCSTGDLDISDVKCDNFNLSVTTGDVNLDRVSAENYIEIESTTGDIDLNLALCKGEMEIECTTGDITFSNSDASYISAETTTGDITGTLVTEKTFYTKTTTGDINVPDSTAENICELETTTGDIDIKFAIN